MTLLEISKALLKQAEENKGLFTQTLTQVSKVRPTPPNTTTLGKITPQKTTDTQRVMPVGSVINPVTALYQ